MSKAFYTKQKFQVRTIPALSGFLRRINPAYTSIIRRLELASALIRSKSFFDTLTDIMGAFPAVERMAIIHPTSAWVQLQYRLETIVRKGWPHTRSYYRLSLGVHTQALLRAAPQLNSGKLYYLDDVKQPELHFVPLDVTYSNARAGVEIRDGNGYNDIVQIPIQGEAYVQDGKLIVDLTGS